MATAPSGIRRRPTLPGRFQPSTISVLRLNFCVRYGNRWNPQAIITGNCMRGLVCAGRSGCSGYSSLSNVQASRTIRLIECSGLLDDSLIGRSGFSVLQIRIRSPDCLGGLPIRFSPSVSRSLFFVRFAFPTALRSSHFLEPNTP